ncbi:MAG: DUF2147 domain-containing protein [Bacteroidota bacterium]
MKRILFIAFGLVNIQFTAFSQDQIKGHWLPEEGKSVIEIYNKDSQILNGKIAWMETPLNKEGEPHRDRQNPNKALQDRPLLGLDMLYDLIYKNEKWRGKLYAPKRGKTVDVVVSLVNEDKLKLTVSFRGFTRNQYWTRTELPE